MDEGELGADVRSFVLKYIDSVAQLEALLLLQHSPAQTWTLGEIAKRLYAREEDLAEPMQRLVSSGLAAKAGDAYSYESASDSLHAAVLNLADAHRHRLIPLTNLIHSKPRRIREFADAFKFRKEP
jgi:hypothetical protein